MGVVRVAKSRSPWRALRPFLLAGAVTGAWLTLSATAATADNSRDSGPLVGGVTSVSSLAASSLAAPLAGADAPFAEPALATPAPAGLLQLAVEPVASTGDQLIAAVPVVNNAVPAGTVTSVAVPVAEVVDSAAGDLAETVAPPVVEALPILEPVLQPVLNLVDATVPPLPLTLTELPADQIAVAGTAASVTGALGETASDATPVPPPIAAENNPHEGSVQLLAATGMSSVPAWSSPGSHSAEPGSPWAAMPSTPAPAGPASGTGSGTSPSGSSGAAAWLDDFGFDPPLQGSAPISGSSQHAPSPVSFDPGSSPD